MIAIGSTATPVGSVESPSFEDGTTLVETVFVD